MDPGKKNEAVSLAKEPKFRTVVLSRLGAHLGRQARWSVDFGAKKLNTSLGVIHAIFGPLEMGSTLSPIARILRQPPISAALQA